MLLYGKEAWMPCSYPRKFGDLFTSVDDNLQLLKKQPGKIPLPEFLQLCL